MQDSDADRLLAAVPRDERLASWRLANEDGSLASRGAGAPALLRTMRLTRPVGHLLGRIPPRALDGAYEAIARNRRSLGRLVPDGPGPRRPSG